MRGYVLERTDQGGGYIAKPGVSKTGATKRLEDARIFATEEQAEAERCPQNEVVVPISRILKP